MRRDRNNYILRSFRCGAFVANDEPPDFYDHCLCIQEGGIVVVDSDDDMDIEQNLPLWGLQSFRRAARGPHPEPLWGPQPEPLASDVEEDQPESLASDDEDKEDAQSRTVLDDAMTVDDPVVGECLRTLRAISLGEASDDDLDEERDNCFDVLRSIASGSPM